MVEREFTYSPSDPKRFILYIAEREIFTDAQFDVLKEIIAGRSNKEIAFTRGVRVHTIKRYVCGKEGTNNDLLRIGLIGMAGELAGEERTGRTGMLYQFIKAGVIRLLELPYD